MSTSVIDLWPTDLRVPDETTPAILMRQQAELLGQHTNGRVTAAVHTYYLIGSTICMSHAFTLTAPAAPEYRDTRNIIFEVNHGFDHPYPAEIRRFGTHFVTCNNQNELEQALRDLFASSQTRNAIRTVSMA